MNHFKMSSGYVEGYLDNIVSICVFGKIEFNGLFTMLGSYRRYYAEHICFGALYPGLALPNAALTKKLTQLTAALYHQNVFGYLTIELLHSPKSG
jgi:hypothetical protein